MVHKPLKPPLRQTLKAYQAGPPPWARHPPSYQVLENSLQEIIFTDTIYDYQPWYSKYTT